MNVLVIGQRGMLAQEVVPCLRRAGFAVVSQGRPALDIREAASCQEALAQSQPDVVINTAAYTAVDLAESDKEQAFAVNRDGAAFVADACRELGVPLIHLSTDYVFDGLARRPYRVDDVATPLGVYGASKWQGEEAVRARHPAHLIVRTAWLYASQGTNFVQTMLRLARTRDVLRVVNDQYGCPTWCRDVAEALVVMCHRIAQDRGRVAWGTYHYCSAGQTTWYEFARAIIEEARAFEALQVRDIMPIPTTEYPTPAPRPAFSVLDSSTVQAVFGITPPAWRERLHTCMQEVYTGTPRPGPTPLQPA
jgi:dTDP-4-dehydrorhamnose reductase